MGLESWLLGFASLWREVKQSSDSLSKELLRVILLRLQVKSTLISVKGSVYRRETDWGIHIPDFDEIVSLTETYLFSKPKPFYASFDGEIVIHLYYILWKCRDGGIRRRALELLDKHPRREGTWDTWDLAYLASVGRWVLSMEEGQRENVQYHEIK
jgi:hypothetical protein